MKDFRDEEGVDGCDGKADALTALSQWQRRERTSDEQIDEMAEADELRDEANADLDEQRNARREQE